VTNDWFCGLIAGYAKCRVFGDVYDVNKNLRNFNNFLY
jgi:hypothetical protein